MTRTHALLFVAALALAVGGGTGRATDDPAPAPAEVADDELLSELKSAPGENEAREKKLRDLYVQAGADDDAIGLQEVSSGDPAVPALHNVVVTKKGQTDAVIVVGGHLDKVKAGLGVIDDWSGACLASNLYQTLRNLETRHTFVFVGFAYEERGLLGSKAFVAGLAPGQKGRIRAMVNLECLGVDGPFLWTNGSTDRLEALAHKVADAHKLTLKDHVLLGVGADSIPFEKAGIPVITFDGLPRDKFRLIHSPADTYDNIQPARYLDAYRIVARFLLALDREPDEVPPEAK
jgi:hypothetical protein